MHVITDANDLVWHLFPLPSADVCHPDCQVIAFTNEGAALLSVPKDQWVDRDGREFVNGVKPGLWAWTIRFTPELTVETNQ